MGAAQSAGAPRCAAKGNGSAGAAAPTTASASASATASAGAPVAPDRAAATSPADRQHQQQQQHQRYLDTCAALERALAERGRARAQRRMAAEMAGRPADSAAAAALLVPAPAPFAAAAASGPPGVYGGDPGGAWHSAVEAYGLLADAALPDVADEQQQQQQQQEEEVKEAAAGGVDDHNNTNNKPASVRPAVEAALHLALDVFRADEALVALFGDRRVYVRAAAGSANVAVGDWPWRASLCGWALSPPRATALVVPDLLKDARFSANAMAGHLGVRSYVGVPLLAPEGGHRLGILSFACRSPRPDFDAASVAVLGNMAEMVARELAREAAAALASRVSPAARLRTDREASAPVLVVERGGDGGGGADQWTVRHANGAWEDGWRRKWRSGEKESKEEEAAASSSGVVGLDLLGGVFDLGGPAAALEQQAGGSGSAAGVCADGRKAAALAIRAAAAAARQRPTTTPTAVVCAALSSRGRARRVVGG
jgi:GAF domain-containing protein